MERIGLFFESWDFFGEAALASGMAGALLGALGIYILLGRLVFMSVTTAQVSSAGVALAFWLTGLAGAGASSMHDHAQDLEAATASPLVAMLSPGVFSILFTIAVMAVANIWVRRSRSPEAILAVLYLFGAAATVLIGTQIVHELSDVQQLLIGNAVLVAHEDFVGLAVLASVMLVLFAVFHRGLEASAFWPQTAKVAGLPVRVINAIRLIALTVAIAYTTRVMGALPVFAFSCLPALAARACAPNLRVMFFVALGIGACSGFCGYVAAFVLDMPVGPVQTAVSLMFVFVLVSVSAYVKWVQREQIDKELKDEKEQ
ncbi:MAG: metal ABC transporter permease [Proteobacteria bacterium]|nr:metal ABC transporter permease [Pseudomonadota bacterium]